MKPDIKTVLAGQREELLDMRWDEYLAFPAANNSLLSEAATSMYHLRYVWEHGRADTDDLQFGRLVHALLVEPQEVEDRYWTFDGVRRGKKYDEFVEEATIAGAEVVKLHGELSMTTAIEASKGFLRNRRVQQLIKAGKAEQAALAVEEGMQCKGRLDWVSTSEHVLSDIKTARDITPQKFGAAFFNYGYDSQLGMYQRWLNRLTGDRWPVEVIVVEKKAPFGVAVYTVPDAVLEEGVDKALRMLKRLRVCIETDTWPGVTEDEAAPLFVPYWAMTEEVVEYDE